MRVSKAQVSAWYAKLGKKGAQARIASQTPTERSAAARKAAQTRWAAVKAAKPTS